MRDATMKHLILIHGRDIKPRGTALAALAITAIVRGLERAGEHAKAKSIRDGSIKVSSAYFGDISNQIEAKVSKKTASLLTDTNDSIYDFRPCFPITELELAFARTDRIPNFTRSAYHKVLEIAEDWRMLDEAAEAASLFGKLLTFGLLNQFLISSIKSDLTAYLTSKVIGSQVRTRLREVIEPSLMADDDICLVSHSLGCIVAYDVFWKYSFDSEHEAIRKNGNQVKSWITLGCPLGEPGVKRNLLDAMSLATEKFPRNQFRNWINIHAEDDFIAHAERMKSAYGAMVRKRYCASITDQHIYNCWHYEDVRTKKLVSNPHDLYGYLMHQKTGEAIASGL